MENYSHTYLVIYGLLGIFIYIKEIIFMFESKNEIYNLLELEAKAKTLETSLCMFLILMV